MLLGHGVGVGHRRDRQVAIEFDSLVVIERRRAWDADWQWPRAPRNLDEVRLPSRTLELELHTMHRQLLLVLISEEDLEQALDLAIWPLRRLVLPDEANLDVDVLIYHAFVALNE